MPDHPVHATDDIDPGFDAVRADPSATRLLAPPRLDLDRVPPAIRADLRASHVGESVAVQIYRGVAAARPSPRLERFARHHRAVELRHLALFEALLPPGRRSRLVGPLRAGGFLMGWLPARCGDRCFYAVIAAVEAWVDGHYARQIARARRLHPDPALLALLEACRSDEAGHSRDAAALGGPPGPLGRLLAATAVAASRLGVALARHL